MEKNNRLADKYQSVLKALSCLENALALMAAEEHESELYEHLRNSAIQCFEFSIDTLWKYLKEYLKVQYDVVAKVATPKAVFEAAKTAGILSRSELDQCFDMVDDRNVTTHTYNEVLAENIVHDLGDYLVILKSIAERVSAYA